MNSEKSFNWEGRKYEILPLDGSKGFRFPYNKKRLIVGRSHTADIVIPQGDISSIHCVIELSKSGFRIYDMNSSNGTFFEGKRIIMQDVPLGGTIQFASHSFILKELVRDEILPPVLDVLSDPEPSPSVDISAAPGPPEPPSSRPSIKRTIRPDIDEQSLPRVIEYPLVRDPKAEFSEYIFEDVETLYPIFNYSPTQASVEVIILHKDRIYSVDYLPTKNGTYNLVGSNPKAHEIEYAYLSKKQTINFVEVKDGDVIIHPLDGYKFTSLSDQKKVLNNSILLDHDDIVCFVNGDIEIYIRGTEAPPNIKAAPVLSKDKELKKYVAIMLLIFMMFASALHFFKVDKELEKEKAPKRIARILYKKKFITKPTKIVTRPKKKIARPKIKKIVKRPKVADAPKKAEKIVKKPVKKPGKKRAKVGIAKKAPPKRAKRNNTKTTKVAKVVAKKSAAKSKARSSRKSIVKSTSKGHVDTYKAMDFRSTMSNLMAKGGSASRIKAASSNSRKTGFSGISGGESATLTSAKISHKVGSIAGTARGTLDSARGTEGLAKKRSSISIGFPDKIEILGSMNPDVIRQILMDNAPYFKSCYQRVLSKSTSSFSGVVDLNFIIGASGRVTRAGVRGESGNVPGKVRKCMVGVLKGIRFPAPLGGSPVEVNQPMNLYPNLK
ncbi:MAG: FHA domain-containing protein [Bacteriovoracaceae bacterium]|nr:FHA domain-containing protein [Bacteriovoracaceae bacterium]